MFWTKMKMLFGSIFSWFEPTLRDFASQAGKVLLQSASQAVIATAKYAIDNDEQKRRTAYELIVDDLKVKGIQVGADVTTSMINRALELAVSKAKAGGSI